MDRREMQSRAEGTASHPTFLPTFVSKMWRVLGIFLIMAWALACSEPAKPATPVEKILGVPGGEDFRGISIGDDFKKVWEEEKEHIVYSMPDELTCRIPMNEKDSTYYDITYNFTDDGLYDISLEIFPAGNQQRTKLASDFLVYYTERYGAGKRSAGYAEWRVMTANGHMVRISLSDSIVHENNAGINVHFNEYAR